MQTFIFYTTEGYTQAPDRQEIDNCQMLGRAQGVNVTEALFHLLAENPWIEAHRYSPDAIIGCPIAEE